MGSLADEVDLSAVLPEFVRQHTVRGACTCGRCRDAGPDPELNQPGGHVADLGFFKVALAPDKDGKVPSIPELLPAFAQLTREHRGVFGGETIDPNDGRVHDFIELGGWLGDQGLALQYMGLGALLGAFDLVRIPGHGPAIGKIPAELKRFFDALAEKGE